MNFNTNKQDVVSIIRDLTKISDLYSRSNIFDKFEFHRDFLLLDSLIRNTVLAEHRADEIKATVIIGGTNVGKSTVTNTLLGHDYAGANVDSAFTRNSTAFIPSDVQTDSVLASYPYAFHNKDCLVTTERDFTAQKQITENQYQFRVDLDDYLLDETILWDTPDVDSVDAIQYLYFVIETVTVSDLVIYVTTQQKYNNDTVLKTLSPLLCLDIPVIICLNQYSEAQKELRYRIRHAIEKTIQEINPNAIRNFIGVHEISYVNEISELYDLRELDFLRREIKERISYNSTSRIEKAMTYIEDNVDRLLKPVLHKAHAIESWALEVDRLIEALIHTYQVEYLENDENFEAFQKLIDRLFIFIKTGELEDQSVISTTTDSDNMMGDILSELNMKLMDDLELFIAQQNSSAEHHRFWGILLEIWREDKQQLRATFEKQLLTYWDNTRYNIDQEAETLINQLKKDEDYLKNMNRARDLLNRVQKMIDRFGRFVGKDRTRKAQEQLLKTIVQLFGQSEIDATKRKLERDLKDQSEAFINTNCRIPLLERGETAINKIGGLDHELRDSIKTIKPRIRRLVAMKKSSSST